MASWQWEEEEAEASSSRERKRCHSLHSPWCVVSDITNAHQHQHHHIDVDSLHHLLTNVLMLNICDLFFYTITTFHQ